MVITSRQRLLKTCESEGRVCVHLRCKFLRSKSQIQEYVLLVPCHTEYKQYTAIYALAGELTLHNWARWTMISFRRLADDLLGDYRRLLEFLTKALHEYSTTRDAPLHWGLEARVFVSMAWGCNATLLKVLFKSLNAALSAERQAI